MLLSLAALSSAPGRPFFSADSPLLSLVQQTVGELPRPHLQEEYSWQAVFVGKENVAKERAGQ